LGFGAALDHSCSQNGGFCFKNAGKELLPPFFGLAGAGIGALIPTGGWQEVYRLR
jgi:hypothetical protein